MQPAPLTVFLLIAIAITVGGYLIVAGDPRWGALPPDTSPSPETAGDHAFNNPPGGGEQPPHMADPKAKFTHFRVGERNVKQLLSDGDVMWIGTSGGIVRYHIDTDQHRLFNLDDGLLARGIFHLSKLDGRLVAGTYGGGMSIYDEDSDTWANYNIPHGLGDAFVYDVLKMRNGDIWIATWSGANRVRNGDLDDRDGWELHTVESTGGGLQNDWVYGLAEGKNGELWLATEGGLARWHAGEWSHWDHGDGQGAAYELVSAELQFREDPARISRHHQRQKAEMGLESVDAAYNPNYIVALLVDQAGVVWAGTWGGGLARFDGDGWSNYTTKDGLPGNHIFSLHGDPDGTLWVGTNNGLARMVNGGFDNFTMADGLFSDAVFSMANADDGSRWIGSYGGVARIASLR